MLKSCRWAMSLLVEEHFVRFEVVEGRFLGGILAGELIGPAVQGRVVVVDLVLTLLALAALFQLGLGNLRNISPFTLYQVK